MTLLNTPMPAERALEIIRSMYESNRMIEIEFIARCYSKLDFGNEENIQVEEIKSYQQFVLFFDDIFHTAYDGWEITIIWINQIIPTYSIGDKVLILSTGEIGEVAELVEEDSEKAVNWYSIEYFWIRVWEEETPKHISEIAKLPNDL